INAVNHGGDSDTIAAIAGSISGSIHGYSTIPKKWIEKLDENVKEEIEKFVEYLCDGNVNDDRNKI
ncbi:MAG: ADP-ribosylglycohydrolase family protein, partial [Finegoldia magna]|nr:ADP-ribosylglycohydrolase family protein [Finegoldia magna]